MRDFVILGSSSIVTPPNPSSPSKHHHFKTPSLPNLKPPTISYPQKSHLNHYAHLASTLSHNGKLQDFAMALDSLVASGLGPAQFAHALDVELVGKGILVGIRNGKVQTVIQILKKLGEYGISLPSLFGGPSMELLGKECSRIAQRGQVELVVELLEILSGLKLSIRELVRPSEIIKQCVYSSNPELAVRYACLLPHAHILFCNIIRDFGNRRDLVSALRAYELSSKNLSTPNMYVYRTIIDVCGLCDDHVKSRHIYEELLNQKITPNIYVYNSLMNVNAHDLGYIFDVHKNMQDLGVKADMASYNILLKACCLAGRVDLAQEVYREVKNLEAVGMLKLDVFTYSTIVKAFADAKLWQMALNIKEDMLSAGVAPNTVAWSSLISACANVGLVEQAIQLFEKMVLSGCEPNTQCFNIILHACVEGCQYDRAFRLFQSWRGTKTWDSHERFPSSSKDSCSVELQNEKHSTNLPSGTSNSNILNFVERFPFTPTTTTYNILLKACGADFYRAKALIDEIKLAGLSPNHISWSILIDICGCSGNVEGAIEILKTMRDSGISPDVVAYTNAIKVCVESKNLKQAFSLYKEMKREKIHPNLVTYNTLLRARSRYGSFHEVQQCLAIYQDMRKAGYNSNDYYLQELIEEWCEGVIQDDYHNQGALVSCNNKPELGTTEGLLLEKVAEHLQIQMVDNLAIDLQGLTKVEARIIVLAVLRMIKENHALGQAVKDDILIIIGDGKADQTQAKHISEVKDAILKLLQDEIGLEIVPAKPRLAHKDTEDLPMHKVRECETRRPAVLQRLKVTRKSLHHWLHLKVSSRII